MPNRDDLVDLLAKHDGVLTGPDGVVRLSSRRRAEITHWFALAGIDLSKVRTIHEYVAARARAAPYFDAWMREVARSGTSSLQRDLLIACVEGDDVKVARLRLLLGNPLTPARAVDSDLSASSETPEGFTTP